MAETTRISPKIFGIAVGAFLVLFFGAVYLRVLHEPGSLYYPFAVLIFIVAPLTGAMAAVLPSRLGSDDWRVCSAVVAATWVLAMLGFVAIYAIVPEFERTRVMLPAFCGTAAGTGPPREFAYHLAGVGSTTLLAGDGQTVVVAAIDSTHSPFPSTVYLARKSDNQILWSQRFEDDLLSANIEDGVLYLYNDKLGYWLDTRTGEHKKVFFTIDNYGGVSPTDLPVMVSTTPTGRWYVETTAVISSWNRDGSVDSRRHVTFNSTAFNCFVTGTTGKITQLWSREPSRQATN